MHGIVSNILLLLLSTRYSCVVIFPNVLSASFYPPTTTVHLSDEAGNLLQWMMQPNPVDRPTLEQVMLHDWVVRGEVVPPAE